MVVEADAGGFLHAAHDVADLTLRDHHGSSLAGDLTRSPLPPDHTPENRAPALALSASRGADRSPNTHIYSNSVVGACKSIDYMDTCAHPTTFQIKKMQ